MNIGFTKKAQSALNKALYFASQMGHTSVGSEHLLLGLLSEGDGERAVSLKKEASHTTRPTSFLKKTWVSETRQY